MEVNFCSFAFSLKWDSTGCLVSAVAFYFVRQKEYRRDLEESIRGKGLTEMEDTPDMQRAKNATQILNEVSPQPPVPLTPSESS